MKRGNVDIKILSDGNRTVAEAALHTYLHPSVEGRGSSSREPGDKSNAQIGEAFAIARALRSLAAHLERQAKGKMKHADEIKRHAAEIAASDNRYRLMAPPALFDIPSSGPHDF